MSAGRSGLNSGVSEGKAITGRRVVNLKTATIKKGSGSYALAADRVTETIYDSTGYFVKEVKSTVGGKIHRTSFNVDSAHGQAKSQSAGHALIEGTGAHCNN